MKYFFSLLFCLFAFFPVLSELNFDSIDAPVGTNVNDILFLQDGMALINVNYNGIFKINLESNELELINDEYKTTMLTVFTWDKDGDLIVATKGGELLKSTDNAVSFTKIYQSEHGSNFQCDQEGNYLFMVYEGLMKSSDKGETWTNLIEGKFSDKMISSLFILGEQEYYLTKDAVHTSDLSLEVFKSTDKGETWTNFTAFEVDTFLIITDLFRHTDGYLYLNAYFKNDAELFKIEDETNGIVSKIETGISPIQKIIKYDQYGFVARTIDGQLFISANSLNSWELFNKGIEYCDIMRITFNPEVGLIATAEYDHVYIFNEVSKSWDRTLINIPIKNFINIEVPDEEHILMTGAYKSIFCKQASDATWNNKILPDGLEVNLNIKGFEDGLVLYNSGNMSQFFPETKYFRSDDFGESWNEIMDLDKQYRAENFVRLDNDNIFLFTQNGMFISENAGLNWSGLESTDGMSFRSAIYSDGNLLAVVATQGIMKSTDKGQSWEPTNNGLTSLAGRDLAIGPQGRLYLSVIDDGIYVSTDSGDSWTKKFNFEGDNASNPFLFDSQGNVYYCDYYKGVYKSDDQGENWTAMSSNIEYEDIIDVQITDDDRLWLLLYYGGLYVTTGPVSSVKKLELAKLSLDISPNPAVDKLNINGSKYLDAKGLTVRVITLDGSTALEKAIDPNETISIDVSELPTGAYLVYIDTGKRIYGGKFLKK